MAAFVEAVGSLEDVVRDAAAEVKTKAGGTYDYTYAGLATYLKAARPKLAAQGLALSQSVTNDDGVVTTWTTVLHRSGEWVTFLPLVFATGQDPQQVGSAMTYGRRYSAMAALGLASEDDDGARAQQGSQQRRRNVPVSAEPAAGDDSWRDKPAPAPRPEPTYTEKQQAIVDALKGLDAPIGEADRSPEAGVETGRWVRGRFVVTFGPPAELDDDRCETAARWLVPIVRAAKNGTEAVQAAVAALEAIAAEQTPAAGPESAPQDPPAAPQAVEGASEPPTEPEAPSGQEKAVGPVAGDAGQA
jgi:hypothetical protein